MKRPAWGVCGKSHTDESTEEENMTKRQAARLAKRIAADPNAGATVTGLRFCLNAIRRRFWEIDLQDKVSGYKFTVASFQDWDDRQEAKKFAAQHGA